MLQSIICSCGGTDRCRQQGTGRRQPEKGPPAVNWSSKKGVLTVRNLLIVNYFYIVFHLNPKLYEKVITCKFFIIGYS